MSDSSGGAAVAPSNLELEKRALEERVEQLLQERTRILERAKREWEQTFDAITTPIGILSPEGHVIRANLAFAERVGLDIRELIGRHCHEVICQHAHPCASCPARTRAHGSGKASLELRTASGALLVMEVFAHPGGENAICVLRDITDERNKLSDVVQTEKMAAMGQLASGVAHEIKNPLAGILAFTQIMRREPNRTADDAEALELIEHSAVRCKAIIDTMLRFGRRSTHEQEPVEPVSAIRDTLALFQMLLKTLPKAKLETSVPERLPSVLANTNHLQQVLLNLLQNAAQALPEGSGTIRLAALEEDGWLLIRVEDTGAGIPPENLDRIFEAHFTTKPTGNGLGLAIVRRLLAQHGARIDLASKVGEGTVFTVRFPLAPAEPRAA